MNHTCPACGRDMGTMLNLAIHIDFDHCYQNLNWRCFCGEEFMSSATLAEHLRSIEDLKVHYVLSRLKGHVINEC